MFNRSSFSAFSLVAICTAALGCAAASDGAPQSGSEQTIAVHADGLTITEADVALGKLVAVFRKDGREITFELRLGPKFPEASGDPELPSSEVDARILDQEGREFYMQMAADRYIDPTWRMTPVVNVDVAARAADFEAARVSVDAFRAATVPPALEELRIAAISIGKKLARDIVEDKSGKTQPTIPTEPEGPTAAGGVNIISYSSARVWDYQIWTKGAFFNSNPIASHSATTLRAWTSGYSLLATWNSCNHGLCASGSGWVSHCNYSGWLNDDGTHTREFQSEPSSSTSASYGGCDTIYSIDPNQQYAHDCNDDTLLQRRAIETDSWGSTTTGLTCAGTPSWQAPTCH